VCRSYSISAIPATYLIDPQGKVVRAGLRGPELHRMVEAQLKKIGK